MPVKIRCRGCDKTLSAPDKARGKVIQCPQCGQKLKVPAEDGQPKPSKPGKSAKQPSTMDTAEFMAGLDLSHAESGEERICPFCAEEMTGDDPVCRSCGMNTETGAMDAREAKKRARKGPDPALFYSKSISDSIQFVREHKGMALRTGWYMSVLAVLSNGCMGMVSYSTKAPPKFFWGMLALLTLLGILGWFWFLTYKVIESTMTKDEKILERINFDMFSVISLGLRFLFWPFICGGPLVFTILLVPLFYPLATVHLTQKYTYKAFVGWEMLKILARNFGPAVFYCVLFLLALLPVLVVAAPLIWLMGLDGGGNPFLGGNVHDVCLKITTWFLQLTGDSQPDPTKFVFQLCMAPLKITAGFLFLTPIWLVAAFPAVFMMRVNGLLGHYNREKLDLVNYLPPNTPATFWVRFLAYTVDRFLWPFASILVVKEPKAVLVGWAVNALMFLTWWFVPALAPFTGLLWSGYMFWMYFAVQESTTTRTTIGKDAFGLIINDVNNKQLSLKQASLRVLGRFICIITLNLGYLLAALPQKRGLHDMIAGTKCCWRGGDR
ncbi:MAG: RDD family protein [Planctomycetaceae bacterium]